MPYSSTLNSNNDNTINHCPYHEVCGHVYLEIAKTNTRNLRQYLEDCAEIYRDGRFEAMMGMLDTLDNCMKLSQDSFCYGGNQAKVSGREIALRQVNFVFDKMRIGRCLTPEQYRMNGRIHLSNDSIQAIQYTVEYEEDAKCNGNGKIILCLFVLSLYN